MIAVWMLRRRIRVYQAAQRKAARRKVCVAREIELLDEEIRSVQAAINQRTGFQPRGKQRPVHEIRLMDRDMRLLVYTLALLATTVFWSANEVLQWL